MPARWLIVALAALLLAGCQGVELYSNLSEKEANDIMALMLSYQIPATRTKTKEFVSITVPRDRVVTAVEILRRHGMPRDHFTDLGTIFQKQGLISSPLEERVRYTYGLSQMLAETITQIDGVLAARVLIVLPEEAQFGRAAKPSSASVFIRYKPGQGVEDAIPTVKMLVRNGVDGLDYDNISVALFPMREGSLAAHADPQPTPTADRPILAGALGGLLLLALSGNGYLLWRAWRARRAPGQSGA